MKHEYTDKITCPWCAFEQEDMDFDEGENIGLIICPSCEEGFYGRRNIMISYSTYKADYGDCPICKEEYVILEDYQGSIGSHGKMCIDCGYKQQKRLRQEYFDNLAITKYGIENIIK